MPSSLHSIKCSVKQILSFPFYRFYKLDVSVRADCFKVVSQIAADLGGLHHLVNCVAYFGSESLGATEDDWEKTMKVTQIYLII